jgi:hypothetical protein
VGDVAGIAAEPACLEQHVTRINDIDNMAGFVGDFDAAMVQRAAMEEFFADDLAHRVDRLAAGGFCVGTDLALAVAVEVATFAHVEEVTGHNLDMAALFIP